jgi:hypothetical protein
MLSVDSQRVSSAKMLGNRLCPPGTGVIDLGEFFCMKLRIARVIFAAAATVALGVFAPMEAVAADAVTTTSVIKMVECIALPTGEVSDEELARLVPDDLPGRVFIRWRTETQEDNYGFNIYRADKENGDYVRANDKIIAGEGSTNVPHEYCFMDTGLERGSVWFYYIESVSLQGKREVLENTMNTKVKVKSVAEERAWIRRKAMPPPDAEAPATTAPASAVAPAPEATPAPVGPPSAVVKETPGRPANPLM